MTRRDWLSGAGTLLIGQDLAGGIRLSDQTVRLATIPNAHVRLSLNENAFGCSPLAVEAIRGGLTDLARYTESDAQLLTTQIAAKEGVLPEQIVIGEVLSALGIQLGLSGRPGGEFIYSKPGFTDLVLSAEQTGGTAVAVELDVGRAAAERSCCHQVSSWREHTGRVSRKSAQSFRNDH